MNLIRRNRVVVFIALGWLAFVVSACDVGGPSAVDGPQVIRDMQQAIAAVKSSHASLAVNIAINFPSINGDVSIEVWQRSPAEMRAEIQRINVSGLDDLMSNDTGSNGSATLTPLLSATPVVGGAQPICAASGKPLTNTTNTIDGPNFTPRDLQGGVLVSDGKRIWLYMPATCQAYKMSAENAETTPTQMQAMIDAIPGLLGRVLEVADVKGIGVEQVGDRAAYKLELTPKPSAAAGTFAGGKVTLWVDKERSLPLKLIYDAGSLGQISITVAHLEVNQPLDDKLFRFVVPDTALVVDLDAGNPQNTTLPQARKLANYPILTPSYLPASVLLVGVKQSLPSQVQAAQGGITFLSYQGNSVNFDIIEAKNGAANPSINQGPNQLPNSKTETMMVRGVAATLISFNDPNGDSRLTLYWNDKLGTAVNISGNLSRDEMLKVAASLAEGK